MFLDTGAQGLSRKSFWISGKGIGAEPSAVWEVELGVQLGWKVNMQSSWSGSASPKSLDLGEPAWHVAAGKVWGVRDSGPAFYWKEGDSIEMVLWGKPLGLKRGSATHLWGLRAEREGRSKKHAQVGPMGKSQGSRVCLCWELTDSRKGLDGLGCLLRWGVQCKVLVSTNQELMRGFQDEAGGDP